MDVKLQKNGELGRELVVTVPAGEVASKLTQRLEEIGQQAKIPGFRPGKVPNKILKQRFGAQVAQEIQQDLVRETMPKAFDQENLTPADQPKIEFGNVQDDADYTYTMRFEIMPEIEPKGYQGVKLKKYVSQPDEKLLNTSLERLANSMRQFEKKTGKTENGDVAVITAKGYRADGEQEALEGAELTDHSVELGSGALIPGFEEQLEGLAAGDEFAIDVTFPEDYHAGNLAGVKAIFKGNVQEVKKPNTPEVNDDFATQFGAENLDDLKNKVTEQLNHDLEEATRQRLKRDLFDALDGQNSFSLPEGMVEQEFQSIWRAMLQDMRRSGMSFEQMDKSEDEIRAEHRQLAERRVRIGLVLSEIGKKEGVNVDNSEIQAEAEKMLAKYPQQYAEKVQAHYASEKGRQELAGPLFENKVCDLIFDKAEITEENTTPETLLDEIN